MRILINRSFFVILILTSCKTNTLKNIPQVKNDTTAIIEFAISQAFLQNDLPGFYQLSKKFYFKDSILFSTDSLPLEVLPNELGSVKFKILSRDSICNLINSDSIPDEVPNYLFVADFEKSDSIYYVLIASKSCLPFGAGGGCEIEIIKRKDSFFVLHKGFSNYN
jgi:hypothetical protein